MKCGACKTNPVGKKPDKLFAVRRLKDGLTPDASGHVDETDTSNWETLGSFWFAVVTKGSKEFARGEEVAAEITHELWCKYSAKANQITTKMQAVRMGRTFNISEPPRNVDEGNQWLVFKAIEIK